MQARRPDRHVVLCELAQADAAAAPDVLTAALGIDGRPGTPPVERIVDVLGDDELILLLDNCEHVLDSAADLVDGIITGCPNVRSSRRAVSGCVWQASSCAPCRRCPPATRSRRRSSSSSAAGGAVSPVFEPDAASVRRSSRSCAARRLAAGDRIGGRPSAQPRVERGGGRDGSAVRVAVGGLPELVAPLVAGGAVSWSFDSLDAELRRVFVAAVGVLAPIRRGDAAAVCGVGRGDVATLLSELVERSLVQRAPGRRYVLLETLRAFGAEQLTGSDEQTASASGTRGGWSTGWRTPIGRWVGPVDRCWPRSTPRSRNSGWRWRGSSAMGCWNTPGGWWSAW